MKKCRKCNLQRIIALAITAVLLCMVFSVSQSNMYAASSLTLTLAKTSSWEEGGKVRSQFSAAVTNSGTDAVSGWKISITVPEGSSMGTTDGWNGTFSLSGTSLTITPLEYNSKIPGGGTAADIGFILTTPKAVDLTGAVSASGAAGGGQASITPTPGAGLTPSEEPALDAPTGDDWLHTDGNKILDENGTEVWITGINWFGYNAGTNIFDGVWSCNMREAIAAIADHGFNLLRIPISAELALDWKNGVYPTANFNQATNPELVGLNSLEIFDLAVKSCKANGIKVMLDIHSAETDSMGHMKNLWYTDKISTQDYYDALSFLAKHFQNDDTVVAYDLKNEPHGKPNETSAIWNDSTAPNNWKYVAETAGNLVLDSNPHALIMIEGIEIYPVDIAANGDFSSTNSADYYFDWWGGNLRGVKDFPIDFGSAERNAQIVYSPHDYGPAVFAQPWFEGGFTYESLQTDCWNDNWLYISKENIAPLLIGEWGGFMTEPNLSWMTDLRQLISEYHLNHTFWCFNANSGDTGGLVLDDFTTWDEAKYTFVKDVLWQSNGKFVSLDHVIPLGASGNGISLSVISGPVQPTENGLAPSVSTSPSPTAASTATQSAAQESTQHSAKQSTQAAIAKATSSSDGASGSAIWMAAAGAVIILAAAGGAGYYIYRGQKKKKNDEGQSDT